MGTHTLFKGVVDELDQIAGYFSLVDLAYKNHEQLGFNFQSQGGEISLVLKRIGKQYHLNCAYFTVDRNFTEAQLAQGSKFVYSQIKEVFNKIPVQIKGYTEPKIQKSYVELGNMDLQGFLMEVCRQMDNEAKE